MTRFLKKAGQRLWRLGRRMVHDRAQRDADSMAAEVGIEPVHTSGGAHDAFTHAYVSARLTIALGPGLAERLGNINEIVGSLAVGARLEAEMDQHNNAIGREIGICLGREGRTSRREIATSVKQALDDGRLKMLRVGRHGEATLVASGAENR